MNQGEGHLASRRRVFAPVLVICAAIVAAVTIGMSTRQARALPSFARQTGQPCGTCHTDYYALTPYGRRFKLLGYTTGGGPFRTTLFPTSSNVPELAAGYAREFSDLAAYAGEIEHKDWVPPVSMMGVIGLTHTDSAQAPPTAPYHPNDNLVLSPVSFFYGGAITEHVGAFAQLTWNAPPVGGFGSPYGQNWNWDNTDIRFANTATIGSMDVIYGITANNNPTVQDVWNTTPAWGYPYVASTVAPAPATHTLIEGALAAHVGSVGAYALINDVLYLEATGYRTLDPHTQNSFGINPLGAPGLIDGIAPYFRTAIEPHWGDHWLMMGAFGMLAKINPFIGLPNPVGPFATFPQTDNYTDVGVDSQYQYQGRGYWLTLRGSYIREFQQLNASFANGLASNPTNDLHSLKLQASAALGSDNTIVLTAQYFRTWGTPDPLLYASLASGLSPDSNGWMAEIAYIPFGASKAPGWPWANVRIGLQYTWYNRFDGTTFGAQNNNTLFLYTWFAM
jgi:hypothetical protein